MSLVQLALSDFSIVLCCNVHSVVVAVVNITVLCCVEKIGLGSSQLEKLVLRATEKIYGKTDGSELQLLK